MKKNSNKHFWIKLCSSIMPFKIIYQKNEKSLFYYILNLIEKDIQVPSKY